MTTFYDGANSATVQDVRVSEYLDASTIRVSWSRAATLEREIVPLYTIYYTAYSTHQRRIQRESTRTISNPRTSEVFHLLTSPNTEHWFKVTISVQVEGEEFQSEKSNKLIFKFGMHQSILFSSIISILCYSFRFKLLPTTYQTSSQLHIMEGKH